MKPLVLLFAAGVSLAPIDTTHSQTYPGRPIRLITSATAGAAADVLSRAVAGKLSELLGQQVVVDNRPGAGATIAAAIAAKEMPDGYTLLHCGIWDTIAPALHQRLPYDLVRDFSAIALIGTTPNVLVVHPTVPATSVQELIAFAKTHPGKLTYASGGVGTSTHVSMELFKFMTTIDIVHVPYKGGPLLMADLVAGRVSSMMSHLPAQLDNIRAGKIRGLAVSTLKRSSRLPELPTLAESGVPGFEVTVWHGLCAPAAVPHAIIATINGEVEKAVSSADLRSRLDQWGVDPQPSSSERFAAFIKSERSRWTKVVKDAGIRPQ